MRADRKGGVVVVYVSPTRAIDVAGHTTKPGWGRRAREIVRVNLHWDPFWRFGEAKGNWTVSLLFPLPFFFISWLLFSLLFLCAEAGLGVATFGFSLGPTLWDLGKGNVECCCAADGNQGVRGR